MKNKKLIDLLKVATELKDAIEISKSKGLFDLKKFSQMENPVLDLGFKKIKYVSLGTQDLFNELIENIQKLHDEELEVVLWKFRAKQDDYAQYRRDKREQEYLGLKRSNYPYNDNSNEYDEVIEDSEIVGDIFDYILPSSNNVCKDLPVDMQIAIDFLPEKQKKVFMLIVFDDYSQKDVANLLSISPVAVHKLYVKAKENFKKNYHRG